MSRGNKNRLSYYKKRVQSRRYSNKQREQIRQAKWFLDAVELCQRKFKALCDAGVMHDTDNAEKDKLVKSVDELATIWAMGKWMEVRRDILKKISGDDISEAVANRMDHLYPDFKLIETKRLKVKFKYDSNLPLTEEERTCILTGEWGWTQAAKNMESTLRRHGRIR